MGAPSRLECRAPAAGRDCCCREGDGNCPALEVGGKGRDPIQGGIPELLPAGWGLSLLKAEGWDIHPAAEFLWG